MPYCTQTDIEKRITAGDLVRLSDQDGDGISDADVVTQAIEDAQSVIDSYLSVKFVVPIAPVPNVLRQYCVTMACYILMKGRGALTKEMIDNYDKAVQWLKDVVAGKAALAATTAPTEAPGAPGVDYSVGGRVFGRDEPL